MDNNVTGGGGGQGAPSNSSTTGGGQPNQIGAGSTSGGALNSPQVIDISEDSMVRLPGQKDPVKYGDYYRNFQSEFTKRAQEAKRVAAEKAELSRQLQDHQRRLQQYEQQMRGGYGQQQQPQKPNLAEQVRALPYLTGQEAASVVESITQQIGQYDAALQKRDAALVMLYKRLQQMEQSFGSIQQRTTMSDFQGKIAKWVKDAGIPEGAQEWAQELYLAYEGDDLDQEFPQILTNRWNQLQGFLKAQEKERVEAARRQPFVPGRGGSGTPSKPLQNLARMSAKEISDAVWPGIVDGGSDT